MRLAYVLTAAAVLSAPAWAEEPHRQLGPHQHGHGELNIAVEGKRLTIELRAPGDDIVGFEHKATTEADQTALAAARRKFAAGLELFRLPVSAGCRLAESNVRLVAGEHEDHADHEEHHAAESGHGKAAEADHDHDHEGGHSQFQVTYTLECAAPAQITGIDFGYFEAFAGAQELDVNVITDKGQAKYEVSRGQPRLQLSGLM